MAPREIGNLLKYPPRAQRACRIIGSDQHDSARAGTDLAFDVGQFGLPGVVLVQIVRVEGYAQLTEDGRVKGIVRARGKQVLSGIDQGRKTQVHGFADARGDEYVAHGRNAFARRLAANGFQGFRYAIRWSITVLSLAHGFMNGIDDVRGRLEVKA